jgi:hypothetical protein
VPSTPADFSSEQDITSYLSTDAGTATSHVGRDIVIPTASGSNLVVCELGPGIKSMMHRTVSIDYVICTHGHIKMELDSGEVAGLKPGVSSHFSCYEDGNV